MNAFFLTMFVLVNVMSFEFNQHIRSLDTRPKADFSDIITVMALMSRDEESNTDGDPKAESGSDWAEYKRN